MGIQSESKLSLKTFLVDEGENKFAGELNLKRQSRAEVNTPIQVTEG